MKPKRLCPKSRREAMVFSVVLAAVLTSVLLVEHSPAAPKDSAVSIAALGLEFVVQPLYAGEPAAGAEP